MRLELLAVAGGMGLFVLALCAKPIEVWLKAMRSGRRQRRRAQRRAIEMRRFEDARRARNTP